MGLDLVQLLFRECIEIQKGVAGLQLLFRKGPIAIQVCNPKHLPPEVQVRTLRRVGLAGIAVVAVLALQFAGSQSRKVSN